MQELHCPLPPGSEAADCRSCTAHRPQAVRQCEALFPLPTAPRRSVTLPTAPCPQQRSSRAHTVQCGAERQAMRHHREGTGGAARHAGCSGQMRPCVTARRRRQGSVGQVRECTGPAMPQHTYTQRAHNTHSPARLPVPVGRHPGLLPFGNSAFGTPHHTTPHHTTPHHTENGRSTTPHCPQAMRRCEAGFPLPTAPGRRGSALHCPLPPARNNRAAGHAQCSVVHSTKQCGTTQ